MRALGLAVLLLTSGSLLAAEVPPTPPGVVVDQARLFSPDDVTKIEALGRQILQEKRVTVRVLTLDDAQGMNPKALAGSALEDWGLGPRGVVLLIVMNPHALYLQPGPGLAAVFDGPTSSRICASVVAPQMRLKAFGAAALGGLGAIRTQLAAPVARPAPAPASNTRGPWDDTLALLIAVGSIGGFALAGKLGLFKTDEGAASYNSTDSYSSSDSSSSSGSSSDSGGSSSGGSGGGGSTW